MGSAEVLPLSWGPWQGRPLRRSGGLRAHLQELFPWDVGEEDWCPGIMQRLAKDVLHLCVDMGPCGPALPGRVRLHSQ